MEIEVDATRCIGAGNCVLTAPDLFDQRDRDGTAVVRPHGSAPGWPDDARRAAALCPSAAITVSAP